MATHSNILFLRIPCTEEPGRLQSIGSQRVEQDWSNLVYMHSSKRLKHFKISLSNYYHAIKLQPQM